MVLNFKKSINTVSLLIVVGYFTWFKPAKAEANVVDKELLIERVIQTYGGNKLLNMKSIQVNDRYKVFSRDQGPNPKVNSITSLHSTLTADFVSGKISIKNWRQGSNGNRLSQNLFDGETGWSINHLRGTHVENTNLTGDVVGAGMLKMVDTVLALRLVNNKASVKLIQDSASRWKNLSILSFETEKSETYFLEIDTTTGLIMRMARNQDFMTGAVYEFSKHREVQGLMFAADMNQLVNGKPSFITMSRRFDVNIKDKSLLSIPEASTQLKGFIDSSTMTVKKLADNVYLAGQGTAFSIFVDVGDYFVGAGGLRGLKKRLAAVNQHLDANKPIKVQVIPDHHRGHLGAIKELEEMGSQLVIAKPHKEIITSLQNKSGRGNDFWIVDEQLKLADGQVEVYDINTAHAENYLLFYVPEARLVFSADHFGTNLVEALPGVNNTIKSFRDEISRLNIKVETYAHAHGPRVLTAKDLNTVLKGYKVQACPEGEAICSG